MAVNKKLECPNCGKEVFEVEVESKCYQTAYLEDGAVGDYGSVQSIGDTIKVECARCGHNITNLVK